MWLLRRLDYAVPMFRFQFNSWSHDKTLFTNKRNAGPGDLDDW